MTTKHSIRSLTNTFAAAATLTVSALTASAQSSNWQDKAISPVTNPIFFEDPRITTEVRPIFMNHTLPKTFNFVGGSAALGGSVQVYAVQARYALTDRLAIIATKDGYIDFRPNKTLSKSHGYANLAAGLKYSLVDDRENQLLLTPGLTVELPTGDRSVFQGRGDGEWNPFISAEKGFGDLHVTGNLGLRVPNNSDKQTTQLHYSLQLDYHTCDYFIPFVSANASTVLSSGKQLLLPGVALNTEMNDLINFGSTNAKNITQVALGGGFRSKVAKNVDFGVAYEFGAIHPVGIFDGRLTADLIVRF